VNLADEDTFAGAHSRCHVCYGDALQRTIEHDYEDDAEDEPLLP
jgi:hypothetical protein